MAASSAKLQHVYIVNAGGRLAKWKVLEEFPWSNQPDEHRRVRIKRGQAEYTLMLSPIVPFSTTPEGAWLKWIDSLKHAKQEAQEEVRTSLKTLCKASVLLERAIVELKNARTN